MSPFESARSTLDVMLRASRTQPWSFPIVVALIIGLGAVGLLSASCCSGTSSLATGTLLAGSAMASGALLGFVFGIPRAIQSAGTPGGDTPSQPAYSVNTNLEQISDWLTKILIGVGLVQARDLLAIFKDASEAAAAAFKPCPVAASVASMIMVYFGLLGFIAFYLWTRIFLTQEFTRADRLAQQSPEFYEGLAQAFLYRPAPDGYRAAIEVAEAYRSRYGNGNWRVWRTLACGYAQQYKYMMAAEPRDSKEMDAVRAKSLEALKQVLLLNPEERDSMASLWNPERATPQEDDLTVFFGDPEFVAAFSRGVNRK
jgi:hypothetical protein